MGQRLLAVTGLVQPVSEDVSALERLVVLSTESGRLVRDENPEPVDGTLCIP